MVSFEKDPITCPLCEGTEVEALPRREIHDFLILPLLLLRPFGCRVCRHRFYGYLFRRV
jgi:hypothetical protein